MAKLSKRHFLTGAELGRGDLENLLTLAERLKQERANKTRRSDLAGMNLVAIYEKPSLRTHLSFSLAMIELGGTSGIPTASRRIERLKSPRTSFECLQATHMRSRYGLSINRCSREWLRNRRFQSSTRSRTHIIPARCQLRSGSPHA